MPTVGIISPSPRGIIPEELRSILPREIEIAPDACNIAHGTLPELEDAFACFNQKIADLAALKVDLIHPAGVPFFLLGPEGERAMIGKWEDRHGIPIFTNPMSQVNALRALDAKRIIVSSYFTAVINDRFTQYLVQAGFDVLESIAYEVDFTAVRQLTAATLKAFFDALRARNPAAEALMLIGPGWRATLGMVEEMEKDYRIPVIHHVPTQSWEIQRRLGFRRPSQGFGRLIWEFP